MKELNTKKNEWKVNGTHKSESGFNKKKNNGIMHKSLKKSTSEMIDRKVNFNCHNDAS